MLRSLNKFSQLVVYGNACRSVWRICILILGLIKGKRLFIMEQTLAAQNCSIHEYTTNKNNTK